MASTIAVPALFLCQTFVSRPVPSAAFNVSADAPALRGQTRGELPAPLDINVPSQEIWTERRCLNLAESDPRKALEMAIKSEICKTSINLLENLITQWADRDFGAARDWVLQIEPGQLRDGLIARVAFSGSKWDPVSAAQIVSEQMTPGEPQNEAAICILHQWALREPIAAANWAVGFADGNLRARALGEIEAVQKYDQATKVQR